MKNIHFSCLFSPLMVCKIFAKIQENEISDSLIPPITLIAEQDHSRLMKLLNINFLRPGPPWKSTDPYATNTENIYKLMDKQELGMTDNPPMGTALIEGDIAFRRHFGGHTAIPDWPKFIKFAEKYFAVEHKD